VNRSPGEVHSVDFLALRTSLMQSSFYSEMPQEASLERSSRSTPAAPLRRFNEAFGQAIMKT